MIGMKQIITLAAITALTACHTPTGQSRMKTDDKPRGVTIIGTPGPDLIIGTPGDDLLIGDPL